MDDEDSNGKKAIPWWVKPGTEKILFEETPAEENVSCRRVFGAYHKALPAIIKVLGKIDQQALDMALFATLDETRPSDQADAIHKLSRSLSAVIDRIRPEHREGSLPGQDPATLIRALMSAVRVGTLLDPEPVAANAPPRPPRENTSKATSARRRVGKYSDEKRAQVLELAAVVEPRRWLQVEIAEMLGVSKSFVSSLLGPRKRHDGAGANTAAKPN